MVILVSPKKCGFRALLPSKPPGTGTEPGVPHSQRGATGHGTRGSSPLEIPVCLGRGTGIVTGLPFLGTAQSRFFLRGPVNAYSHKSDGSFVAGVSRKIPANRGSAEKAPHVKVPARVRSQRNFTQKKVRGCTAEFQKKQIGTAT